MHVYEHGGKKFISINGKDYFLIRGYQNSRGNLIFVQVSGKTPLNKEDLTNNSWGLIRSKAGKDRAWTAFNKSYFRYDQEADEKKLAFIGASTEGSCFLALKWLNEKFNLKLEPKVLARVAEQYANQKVSSHELQMLRDKGNTGAKAVLLEISSYFDESDALKIFKGEGP